MKTFFVLVLISFGIFAETSIIPFSEMVPDGLPGEYIDGRIIGGYLNKRGEIPYIVSLGNDTIKHLCAGSIIDHEWILTAAHCLPNTKNLSIAYGTINWRKPFIQHFVDRKNFFIHEAFDWKNTLNDIALIKAPYVEFSESINKVNLPNVADADQELNTLWARASGWGSTTPMIMIYTNLLLSIDVQVVPNKFCNELFPEFPLHDTQLCTSSRLKSTCHGDSGGPLVLHANETVNDTPILIGITSFGQVFCRRHYPNYFTRVSSFLPWINATIESVK